jgi:hypothetical protein
MLAGHPTALCVTFHSKYIPKKEQNTFQDAEELWLLYNNVCNLHNHWHGIVCIIEFIFVDYLFF